MPKTAEFGLVVEENSSFLVSFENCTRGPSFKDVANGTEADYKRG